MSERARRITMTIDGNIDAVKREIQERLGVSLTYNQTMDYLIKFYRDQQKVQSQLRGGQ